MSPSLSPVHFVPPLGALHVCVAARVSRNLTRKLFKLHSRVSHPRLPPSSSLLLLVTPLSHFLPSRVVLYFFLYSCISFVPSYRDRDLSRGRPQRLWRVSFVFSGGEGGVIREISRISSLISTARVFLRVGGRMEKERRKGRMVDRW